MLREFKKVIAVLGMAALLVPCLLAVSFAYDGHDGHDSSSHDRSSRYSRSDQGDSHNQTSHRYNRHQRSNDDEDDDAVTTPPTPVPVPTPTPTPVPVPTPTPALDGQALYNQYCSGCHGTSKRGSSVSLINSGIKNVGSMRSLGSLSAAQIDAISKY